MRRNKLRELLDADQPSLGTHVHSPWPSVFEMVGYSGQFDYIEYVSEYAPYDLHNDGLISVGLSICSTICRR